MAALSPELRSALVAHQNNDLVEAERFYRAALVAEPENPDAMALLGVLLGVKGQHDAAIALTAHATTVDPQSPLLFFHHGNVLMNAQKLPEAVEAFRHVILLQPTMADAYYNLGNALRAMDDWGGAIAAYQSAIQHNPAYAEAYNNLALCYVHEQNFVEAEKAAEQAVAINPNYGDGWVTLCNVAEKQKNYARGEEAGLRAITLSPHNHYAWFGYGVILNRLDRDAEAIVVYQRALALKPERADIWDNLGQTYQSLGRLEEAEAIYHKTIEVAGQTIADEYSRMVDEEEYGTRHWHLALIELLRGKYVQGFARYRSRFKEVGGLKRPAFSRPLWKGEDIAGKTLLVCDEQGYGDTLMLCRYLPILRARGVKIIFSVHRALRPLFEAWGVADQIIIHGTVVPLYDCYCSVFDLPHLLGTRLETIPADVPYLPALQPDARTALPAATKPRVGVVWGGNPLHANDLRRSVPLIDFAAVLAVGTHDFFSLNRDMRPGDEEWLQAQGVTNLGARINDFADAARFVGQMDLVITCDTSTAHLAGGLAKPTWVMLPFASDWRWLTDRSDSPWYPTARLFRQPSPGNWNAVVTEIVAALKEPLA